MLRGMIVGRVIGAVIFLAGLGVLVRDGLIWLDAGRWVPLTLGEMWYGLDRASFDLAEAASARYLSALIWSPGVTTLLDLWMFAVLIVIGGTLFCLCRERDPRRR
jgi:hypothetical protein